MTERERDGVEGDVVEATGMEPVEPAADDGTNTPGIVEGPQGVRLTGRRRGGVFRRKQRAMVLPGLEERPTLTPEQRLLVLDSWQRSGLPAQEFGTIAGLSAHTLYAWRRRFEAMGPEGLSDRPRGGPRGSRLVEATRRAILLMKEAHPDWGADRIHDMLLRGEGFAASSGAILRVLREAGYESTEVATKPHPERETSFERARPNQLWQTDLFTFLLKRENRRVYLVVFLDDHSRYVVGYGVHATASGVLVREVLEAAIANFGAPEEILTDNGTQYVTWRGKSGFTKLLERRGIRHVVARPRHPQTLGKTERFWGTLWRECLETAIFQGMDDARRRIGHFIDYYNFQRTHQGIDGLVPADRYFQAAPEVLRTLRERVAGNAVDLARDGIPRRSFYIAGRVGDEAIALHGEGARVVLTRGDGTREEVDLAATGRRAEPGEVTTWPEPVAVTGIVGAEAEAEEEGDEELPPPGTSSLDEIVGAQGEEERRR
jgi:transposase InsO family protein